MADNSVAIYTGFIANQPLLVIQCQIHFYTFQTIQFSISIQFNRQKHFYFELFSLVK